jgi:hypothetical protein
MAKLLAIETVRESLPAGQEMTIATTWTIEAGERVLRAKADPNGEIFELDEANNSWADYGEFCAPAQSVRADRLAGVSPARASCSLKR